MRDRLILLADPDRTAAEELEKALGDGWVTTCVGTSAAALEELQTKNYAAAVISLQLHDLPAEHLLNRIREYYPNVLRLVVASEKERERLIDEALGAHQFLVRPFGAAGLRSALQGTVEAEHWVPGDPLRELIGQMRSLPTVPALYLETINALNDASSTTEEVGELIAKDMAITSKLLQVINSPYFGLPRAVTNPSEAVGLLGFATTQALVVAVELLSEYERLQCNNYWIEQLWLHGATVAREAKRIAVLQVGEGPLADETFAAGLLHDIGKAILAGNFPDRCAQAASLARTNQRPLFEIEREMFGAHHGEVGAYLLSLWALPSGVVSTAAWHHEPRLSGQKDFSTLTAVHVANELWCVSRGTPPGMSAPRFDRAYLTELGLEESLRNWCEQILGPEAAARYSIPESTEPAPPSLNPDLSESVQAPTQTAEKVANDEERMRAGTAAVSIFKPRSGSEGITTASVPRDRKSEAGRSGILVKSRWVGAITLGIFLLSVGWMMITQFTDNRAESTPVAARELKPVTRPKADAVPESTEKLPIQLHPSSVERPANETNAVTGDVDRPR